MNWTLLGWISAVAVVPVALDLAIMYGARKARDSIRIDTIVRKPIPSTDNASAVTAIVETAPVRSNASNAVIEQATPGDNAVIRVAR